MDNHDDDSSGSDLRARGWPGLAKGCPEAWEPDMMAIRQQEILIINPAGNDTIVSYVLRAGVMLMAPMDIEPGHAVPRELTARDSIVIVNSPKALPVSPIYRDTV